MKAINSTLLQMLFDRPLPQQSRSLKEVYAFFMPRMFPNKENFINFLKADTFDEQMQYARKITKRLCFESNFPTPYNTLDDVLSLETAEKVNEYKKGQHVARDHFLHIVYLYLLGIYIFFYNKLFYEKIKDNYWQKRENYSYENDEYGWIKGFISSWKYFCIYHDVGYSIEILSNQENKINIKNIPNFKSSFAKDKIKKELVISSTMKSMSNLIVMALINKNSKSFFGKDKRSVLNKKLLNSKVITFNYGECSEDTFKNIMMNFEKIKIIIGFYLTKCIQTVV